MRYVLLFIVGISSLAWGCNPADIAAAGYVEMTTIPKLLPLPNGSHQVAIFLGEDHVRGVGTGTMKVSKDGHSEILSGPSSANLYQPNFPKALHAIFDFKEIPDKASALRLIEQVSWQASLIVLAGHADPGTFALRYSGTIIKLTADDFATLNLRPGVSFALMGCNTGSLSWRDRAFTAQERMLEALASRGASTVIGISSVLNEAIADFVGDGLTDADNVTSELLEVYWRGLFNEGLLADGTRVEPFEILKEDDSLTGLFGELSELLYDRANEGSSNLHQFRVLHLP